MGQRYRAVLMGFLEPAGILIFKVKDITNLGI